MRGRRRERGALIALALTGVAVGFGILVQQTSFSAPAWLPIFGKDTRHVYADFSTAQAVTPGQGQPVTVAGVKVGLVGAVSLHDGRARVRMDLERRYGPVYRDARIVLRPRTPLRDMTLALDPGTPRSGRIGDDGLIAVSQTLPDVNVDQVLSSLDADTRGYLQLLLAAAGTAFDERGKPSTAQQGRLRAALRRFSPLARHTRRLTSVLAARRAALREVIGDAATVATELGGIDRTLTQWVESSNQALGVFARRDDDLRQALTEFPTALAATQAGLRATSAMSPAIERATTRLQPFAATLPDALAATRTLTRTTTPVLASRLRPDVTALRQPLRRLRGGAAALADVTPPTSRTFGVLRDFTQALSHNPPGRREEGYLFWAAWIAHIGASVTSLQDAHGPIIRTLPLLTCPQLDAVAQIEAGNETLGALIKLSNLPDRFKLCPNETAPVARPSSTPAATTTGTR